MLEDVIADDAVPMFTREIAASIYAFQEKRESITVLTILAKEGSWYAKELVKVLYESGWIDLYA